MTSVPLSAIQVTGQPWLATTEKECSGIVEYSATMRMDFFSITCFEDDKKREEEICVVMESDYGEMIRNWLEKYFS